MYQTSSNIHTFDLKFIWNRSLEFSSIGEQKHRLKHRSVGKGKEKKKKGRNNRFYPPIMNIVRVETILLYSVLLLAVIELTYSRSLSPFQVPRGRENESATLANQESRGGFDLGIYHRYRQPLIWHCAAADTGGGSSIFSWRVNDWP